MITPVARPPHPQKRRRYRIDDTEFIRFILMRRSLKERLPSLLSPTHQLSRHSFLLILILKFDILIKIIILY